MEFFNSFCADLKNIESLLCQFAFVVDVIFEDVDLPVQLAFSSPFQVCLNRHIFRWKYFLYKQLNLLYSKKLAIALIFAAGFCFCRFFLFGSLERRVFAKTDYFVLYTQKSIFFLYLVHFSLLTLSFICFSFSKHNTSAKSCSSVFNRS